MPRDSFGRDINYLRISLTDHCNLRCVYCMPVQGLNFMPGPELLTAEEIETVVRAAVAVGFTKFRLTGGEPLLRRDVVDVARRIGAVPGVRDLALTTNAILLPNLVKPLVEAGLRRVNIHVDTLHPERLKRVMRFGAIDQIWAGIEAAEAAGLTPIKLNAVVVRDFNEEDVVDLAALAAERDWQVRFIELMPLGGGECARLSLSQYVPNTETRARIEARFGPLQPMERVNLSDESVNFRMPGGRGVVGFISPVSAPYCGTCNRMRLTADGKFHLCLLHDDELDVKSILRSGGDADDLSEALQKAVGLKPTGHALQEGIYTERRAMFQLGG